MARVLTNQTLCGQVKRNMMMETDDRAAPWLSLEAVGFFVGKSKHQVMGIT